MSLAGMASSLGFDNLWLRFALRTARRNQRGGMLLWDALVSETRLGFGCGSPDRFKRRLTGQSL